MLPGSALLLAGLAKPVRYTGGWSENSISTWVKQQAALQMQVIKGKIDDLIGFARDAQPSVLVVGFMTAAQRNKRLLEASARSVQALGVRIALGDDALAAELGAGVPSVVVCRLGAERWPLLRGQSLGQRDVENFLRLRALPSVTPVGEVERTFASQVRSHPVQMHVMLVHRSGKQGPHELSERALREMRDAAPAFEGRALFLSYDFYDNNPEMFTVHGVLMNELPAAGDTWTRWLQRTYLATAWTRRSFSHYVRLHPVDCLAGALRGWRRRRARNRRRQKPAG